MPSQINDLDIRVSLVRVAYVHSCKNCKTAHLLYLLGDHTCIRAPPYHHAMLPSPVLSLSASSTPPLHVLRGILRHIKSSPSHKALAAASPSTSLPASAAAEGGRTSGQDLSEVTLRDYVLAEYRKNVSVPPQRGLMLRRIAYDYLVLKDDLTERARLHELDGGADTKLSPAELTRRAAARAGLQVPKLDPGL